MSQQSIRVGIVCDFREEGWHSMDLIADMLLDQLPASSHGRISATRLCPPLTRRWTRVPIAGRSSRARLADRLTGRFRDYPRWLAPRANEFDVFHIIDHSYAHLVEVLPHRRTVVTCNDTDAIEPRFPLRSIAARILDGLASAERVACISEATRTALLATGRVARERVSVEYLGVHPSCTPCAQPRADRAVEKRLGASDGAVELLHVGSTIPRKRIDVLLDVFHGVSSRMPNVRLIRVGDPFTQQQTNRAKQLGIDGAIVQLPFLDRDELAAVYRRAALLLLPSEREGFGLPVVEAMASGTPVVASAISALGEVGGSAAAYCPVGDVAAWVEVIAALLDERRQCPAAWARRRQCGTATAARFSWRAYATAMARAYEELA
jgi:glycosyltransferase involved in cell wall biosynthesis